MTVIYIGDETYEVYIGTQKVVVTKDEVIDLYDAIVIVDKRDNKGAKQ